MHSGAGLHPVLRYLVWYGSFVGLARGICQLFTSFLTRKNRVRSAKVRKSQMILERLEDRQLLNGSVTMSFGQTLKSVAPSVDVDSHNVVVAGHALTRPTLRWAMLTSARC